MLSDAEIKIREEAYGLRLRRQRNEAVETNPEYEAQKSALKKRIKTISRLKRTKAAKESGKIALLNEAGEDLQFTNQAQEFDLRKRYDENR